MPQRLDFNGLCDFVNEHKGDKCLITFHSIGDRDAVGTAIPLSKYFDDAVVATPDYITNNARYMIEKVGYGRNIDPKFRDDAKLIIVLDTNTLESVGSFKEKIEGSSAQLLFIDHHLLTEPENRAAIFNDESFNSTASIVYDVLKKLGQRIDKESSILLLNGIISDSAEFKNATSETFMQISELLEDAKTTYPEVMAYFHNPITLNNRYYLIHDLYASTVEITGNYLVVYGQANSHANIAADMAIQTGADFSIFWSVNEKEASLSARLRPPLDTKLHIHLGKILHDTASYIDGNGGGHPCAAGAYGPNRDMINEAVGYVLKQIKQIFSEARK